MKNTKFASVLLIVGAIIVFGLTAVGAASVYKTVIAVLSPDITVKLDDQMLSLKDASGKALTPLSVDGSTYLPIRSIAEIAGLSVSWDSENKTINLSHNTNTTTNANIGNQIGIRGTVKNLVKGKDGITFTVEGKKQIDTLYDIATVTVNRETVLENVEAYSEIKEGYVVEAYFPEFVVQSYPVMSAALKLAVISSNEIVVRGTVKDIVRGKDGITFLVDGKKESDTLYDKATVTVNMKTVLEDISTFGDIKEGDILEAKFKGNMVAESYPVMGVAASIKVTSAK